MMCEEHAIMTDDNDGDINDTNGNIWFLPPIVQQSTLYTYYTDDDNMDVNIEEEEQIRKKLFNTVAS